MFKVSCFPNHIFTCQFSSINFKSRKFQDVGNSKSLILDVCFSYIPSLNKTIHKLRTTYDYNKCSYDSQHLCTILIYI